MDSRHFRIALREQASPEHRPRLSRFVQLRRLVGYAGGPTFRAKRGERRVGPQARPDLEAGPIMRAIGFVATRS